MTDRVLLDTAVFVYAIGAEHRYRMLCQELLRAVVLDQVVGETAVLAVQELMHQRARRTGNRGEAAAAGQAVMSLCTVHHLDVDDLDTAAALFEAHHALDAADACHAAIAINRGIQIVISPDRAFGEVPGLEQIDPIVAGERYARRARSERDDHGTG